MHHYDCVLTILQCLSGFVYVCVWTVLSLGLSADSVTPWHHVAPVFHQRSTVLVSCKFVGEKHKNGRAL